LKIGVALDFSFVSGLWEPKVRRRADRWASAGI